MVVVGGLHQKNSVFISFVFFSPVSILFFDDSSWPWLHSCGRRGTVEEVSVTIEQWMPADSDRVWADAGQLDSRKFLREKKTQHFTPHNCSAHYCCPSICSMRHRGCLLYKYLAVVGGCPPPVDKNCLHDLLLVSNIVKPFLTLGSHPHRTRAAPNVSFPPKLF